MTTVQRRCHDEARPQHDAELGNGRVATRAFCWRCPNVKSAEPRYQQARISDADKCGKWRLIVSSHGWDGSLQIRQDGRLYAALFDGDVSERCVLPAQRNAYWHVANVTPSLARKG
ncbi:hypothetical protein [Mycetohabitans rhizoxinica]|uniref:pirin family protein n=1 Tax=Mycetohabitans rhizoxinica TaxID=412963 RepID=UPI0030CF2C15